MICVESSVIRCMMLGCGWLFSCSAWADDPPTSNNQSTNNQPTTSTQPETITPTASGQSARQLYSQAARALLAKDLPQATLELSRLIGEHPQDELAPLAAVRLAECHLANGKRQEAISVLEHWLPEVSRSTQAKTLDPAVHLKAHYHLARAYMLADDHLQVVTICEEQLTLYPNRDHLTEVETRALQQLDSLATQARQRQIEVQATHLRAAATDVSHKQYAQARLQLDKVQLNLLSPAWSWRYQVLLSQCELGSGNPKAAATELAKIDLSALSASGAMSAQEQLAVRMIRLDAAMASGAFVEAQHEIDALSSAAVDDARHGPAIALRAVELAMLRKDRELADRLARAAKQAFPTYQALHEFDLLLARNALARIEFAEARHILQELISHPPVDDRTAVPRAQWLLGESYFLSQDYQRAISEYSHVIDGHQAPLWTESALMQRGKCYELLGQSQSAITDYQHLTSTLPNSALRADAQARLNELGVLESGPDSKPGLEDKSTLRTATLTSQSSTAPTASPSVAPTLSPPR
ncbi:MAG: tetratricopeptide repeat protein [Pirellulaceae bacterium]|nr:tetratricopeptide repeat protein [Pirellulaceae bacterium]